MTSMRPSAFALYFAVLLLSGCSKALPAAENKAQAAAEAKQTISAEADRVEVYYFHGDRRCPTCRGIQRTVEETLREKFSAETAAGKVVYREVNIDRDENKHFVRQFELSFSTMVVAEIKDHKTARWENCQDVWNFAHEHKKLKDYVAERVTHYLAELEKK